MKSANAIIILLNPRNMPSRQSGIVLFIALIVLIAMTLAGIAMMKQLGAGVGIAGNLAFRQNATTAADLGIEIAQGWLVSKKSMELIADDIGNGYFATWQEPFDPVNNYSWSNSNSISAGNDGNGNTVRYVIHRLCAISGLPNVPGQHCVTLDSALAPKDKEGGDTASVKIRAALTPYFRVTTRTDGPRGTVSYTQVMMY